MPVHRQCTGGMASVYVHPNMKKIGPKEGAHWWEDMNTQTHRYKYSYMRASAYMCVKCTFDTC